MAVPWWLKSKKTWWCIGIIETPTSWCKISQPSQYGVWLCLKFQGKNPQKCWKMSSRKCGVFMSFLHGVYTYQGMKRHMIYVFLTKKHWWILWVRWWVFLCSKHNISSHNPSTQKTENCFPENKRIKIPANLFMSICRQHIVKQMNVYIYIHIHVIEQKHR